jgi:hypothetical protein
VHCIGYTSNSHQDHRAALTIFDFIRQVRTPSSVEIIESPEVSGVVTQESGFYISDFHPAGTHISGQTVELLKAGTEDFKTTMIVGNGLSKAK